MSAYVAVISHIALIAYKIGGASEIKGMVQRFTPKQQEVYNGIRNERKTHYLIGLAMGLVIAVIFATKNKALRPKNDICAFVGIGTFVANMFYELMPKSEWMVEHLDNAGDVQRWNTVYKRFRTLTAYSELVGFVLFALSHN